MIRVLELSRTKPSAEEIGRLLSGSDGLTVILASDRYEKTREPIVVKRARRLVIVARGSGPHVRSTVDRRYAKNDPARKRRCGPADLALQFEECRDVRLIGLHLFAVVEQRHSCGRDSALAFRNCQRVSVAGCTIDGASSSGIIFYRGCRDVHVQGNVVRNTMADGIHVTGGTRHGVIVDNLIDNRGGRSDDGIACVSYASNSSVSGDLLIARNAVLGGSHGRGIAVDGGDRVRIFDNAVLGSNGAGVLLSGRSSYATSPCSDSIVFRNRLFDVARGSERNDHSPLLLSGDVRRCYVAWNFSCGPSPARSLRELRGAFENEIYSNVQTVNRELPYSRYADALSRQHTARSVQRH